MTGNWRVKCIPARPLRMALVNMPWARCDAPSIQCGTLKAALAGFGHSVDVFYPNLELSAELGGEKYLSIANLPGERHLLLGDWLFTSSVYGPPRSPYPAQEYLQRYQAELAATPHKWLTLGWLRYLNEELLPDWILRQAVAVDWGSYDLVGFTSTFAQNLAAIALAQQIMTRPAHPLLVFGGANFDGDMGPEYVRVFPAIECAVRGEGEIALPMLAARVSRGEPVHDVPGVITRDEERREVIANGYAPKCQHMDEVPVPDYRDYFDWIRAHGTAAVLGEESPALLFETSRGCWWGEKHHCTFCGLNAESIKFRAKSPGRVIAELRELSGQYKTLTAVAVDNIMDMGYLKSVCGELRSERWDLQIFFEVKANLTRDHLRTLRESGIVHIQPGIESLSSNVLRLMRKGSSMLMNVCLLKWCRYYGIHVDWNILCGFPGEDDADYEQQIDLVPRLVHLMPPSGVVRLWLERFSPYYERSMGMTEVRPKESYRFVYPVAGIDLAKIAYFFDYSAERVASDEVVARLAKMVAWWRDEWRQPARPMLTYQRGPDWISILDTRGASARKVTITGWRALAFEYCSAKPHSHARITEFLSQKLDEPVPAEEAGAFLDSCVSEDLMIAENEYYFSLALPVNPNW